jgi:hypothetical protein
MGGTSFSQWHIFVLLKQWRTETDMKRLGKTVVGVLFSWTIGLFVSWPAANRINIQQEFFTALSAAQAAVIGIVIALFVLSSELTADRFSIRILETINEDSIYSALLSLFGISIFTNLLAILFFNDISGNAWWTFMFVFCTTSYGVISFLSLIFAKEEFFTRPHPDTVTERVRQKISVDSLARELRNSQNPFSSFFESAKITLKSQDKQAAGDLITTLGNSIHSNLAEALIHNGEQESKPVERMITQMSTIANISVSEEISTVSHYCLNWQWKVSKICYENSQLESGSHAINVSYRTLRDLMSDSTDNNQTVRQIDWDSFGRAFDLASKENHETGIRQATNLVSMYSMDIEEEYEPVTSSASLHSLDSLVSSFLHAWKVNLDAVAEQPKSGSIYWRDSKLLELGEYEYNFNHFFDNFDTIVRAISRIESKSIAEPGIYQLSGSLLEGLFKTTNSALASDNQDAAIEMMAIAIICGARFNNMRADPEQFTEKLFDEFEGEKDEILSLLEEVIPQLEADEEVELFNTNLQASHFLPMLAVNDEENWFRDLQQYIGQVQDETDT